MQGDRGGSTACPCPGCDSEVKPKQKLCGRHTSALNALKSQMKTKPKAEQTEFQALFRNKDVLPLASMVADYQRECEQMGTNNRGMCRPAFEVARWHRAFKAERKNAEGVRCEWMEFEEWVGWHMDRKRKGREAAIKIWNKWLQDPKVKRRCDGEMLADGTKALRRAIQCKEHPNSPCHSE